MESQKEQVKTFLSISSILTGYDEIDLLGTGMTDAYFHFIIHETSSADLSQFLSTSKQILTTKGGADEITKHFKAGDAYGTLAKKIITLWYMGNWDGKVVSAQSYTHGLIWKTAETHPPGAVQPGFASWQKAPQSVK